MIASRPAREVEMTSREVKMTRTLEYEELRFPPTRE